MKSPANYEMIDLISNDLTSLESTFMFFEHMFPFAFRNSHLPSLSELVIPKKNVDGICLFT